MDTVGEVTVSLFKFSRQLKFMSSSHYSPKQISDIKTNDSRVSIIGEVINTGGDSFILDDGTGKIEIDSDAQTETGKLVRVFCSIIDGKLKVDVIQNVEGLDLNLFKNVNELYNKAGV